MTKKTEMVHELRIQTGPFEDLLSGAKTGEVRNSDRGFKVGDFVLLNEVAGAFPVPTGRHMRRKISHIQTGFGLPDGIVVLSYAPAEDVRAVVDGPAYYRVETPRVTVNGEVTEWWPAVIWYTPEEFSDLAAPYRVVDQVYHRPQRPVVMPERKPESYSVSVGLIPCHEGWNACLDEFEKLNK